MKLRKDYDYYLKRQVEEHVGFSKISEIDIISSKIFISLGSVRRAPKTRKTERIRRIGRTQGKNYTRRNSRYAIMHFC